MTTPLQPECYLMPEQERTYGEDMKRLHACEICGFLSTLGSEFTRVDGILVDKDCADRVGSGEQPHSGWFASAKRRTVRS